MKILIDTHAVIWFRNGDPQLSANALAALTNSQFEKRISIVALWEIAIKVRLGKLKLSRPLTDLPAFMATHNFQLFDLNFQHILRVSTIALFHRDPFDRMLISQALVENFIVVTKDPNFPAYGVTTIW